MLGPHVAGLHLGLNVPYVTTPKGLLISKPAMAEPSRIWTPDDIAWSPTSFASGHNERDEALGPLSGKYCADLRQVVRRKTRTVTAGPVKFGSDHPCWAAATTEAADSAAAVREVADSRAAAARAMDSRGSGCSTASVPKDLSYGTKARPALRPGCDTSCGRPGRCPGNRSA